ncbi:glycosyl hydrolase family 18 protein [Dactylosporangium sp. NPDC005572]|uniref:chitinase C-terminal domain-containing protein n=1 Tax=Dactylosporangium sp. NPDC005572 TaxID=3156889 RepID=UPI0033B2342B
MRRRALHLLSAATAALVAASAAFFVTTASAEVDHAACRPDGLYQTPGVTVPYCNAYDTNGRETLGADHGRRIIGYFTSWRTGKNGAPAYLASQIPWDKITHINYAFAHVDGANKISVGTPTAADNVSTNMTWPGVAGAEMDPAYSYTGHFNLLNKYKKQHPNVKTLISVGGWAETGGYFGDDGSRVDSGGFYRMTTTGTNTVNTAGINTFADSVVSFLRTYGFDGVDIDYEYPTSNNKAGNPLDFAQADAKRAGLNASYHVLMKTLREKLDAASAADGKYYMVTVAAPASGWLLRGMEAYQALQYLDYVNIMSYDLHGAWNHFVGPNAALYDNGDDAELAAGGVYGAYQNIGYLNTDWAYHYFRGAMQSGRINIGVPYYTRGFRGVTGGTNGLWGRAALPDQTKCPAGTGGTVGSTTPCGNGAVGIDNLWHDTELNAEVPAGANPMWHAKNLQDGRQGSYLEAYGLTPATDPEDRISGTYARNYSSALVAPWLWNAQKQVFLSTEDDQSIGVKADYVVNKGIGGVMIWELAGDYAWNATRGEYYMGNTMTTILYDKFKTAGPYGAKKANITLPTATLNVGVQVSGFALGDNNYPINPELRLVNNTGAPIPAGAQLEFDYPTTTPGTLGQQSGWALTVVSTGHTGSNVGGLKGDFHRVRLTIPAAIAAGSFAEVTLNYQLPISGPSNFTLAFGGQTYALAADYARGGTAPTASPTTSTSPSGGTGTCTAPAWSSTAVYTGGNLVSYNGRTWKAQWWTQGDTPGVNAVWVDQGACSGTSPSASTSASASPSTSTGTGCAGLPVWNSTTAYSGNTVVQYSNRKYRAKWWTQGENPSTSGQWGAWEDQGAC